MRRAWIETQVIPASGATVKRYTAAATITAGQVIYDSGSYVASLADANASEATSQAKGIACNGASTGQPVDVLTDGTITIGAAAAPTEGVPYFLSKTAGGICPIADLTTTDTYITYLGMGTGSNALSVKIHITGAQAQ